MEIYRDDDYICDVVRITKEANRRIDQGEYLDLAHKLAREANSGSTKRMQYVFDYPKDNIALRMIACVGLCVFFLASSMMCLATICFTELYRSYASIALAGSAFFTIIDAILLYRTIARQRFCKWYPKYKDILQFKDMELIDDLAAYAHVETKKVIADLNMAIKLGLIPQGHWGTQNRIFIVSDNVYDNYSNTQAVYDSYYDGQIMNRKQMNERASDAQEVLDQIAASIGSIEKRRDQINLKAFQVQISRIKTMAAIIAHEIDIHPEQMESLNTIVSCYLRAIDNLLEALQEDAGKAQSLKLTDHIIIDVTDTLDVFVDSFSSTLERYYADQNDRLSNQITSGDEVFDGHQSSSNSLYCDEPGGTNMDQVQQSLCDLIKIKPECLTNRNILRSALADYIPNDKLRQNLLLNAFDNDVIKDLRKPTSKTLNALNCISQMEKDYGVTEEAARWSIQTWCYLLGLNSVGDKLAVKESDNHTHKKREGISVSEGTEASSRSTLVANQSGVNNAGAGSNTIQRSAASSISDRQPTSIAGNSASQPYYPSHDLYKDLRYRQAEANLEAAQQHYNECKTQFGLFAIAAGVLLVMGLMLPHLSLLLLLPGAGAFYLAYKLWSPLESAEKRLSQKQAELDQIKQSK